MRLHQPVHLHRQPHLGIPEPRPHMFQGGVTPPAQANGQFPTNVAAAGAGFAAGGYVDNNTGTLDTSQFSQDPTNTDSSGAGNYGVADLVSNANNIYQNMSQKVMDAYAKEKGLSAAEEGGAQGGGTYSSSGSSSSGSTSDNDSDDTTQSYAEGGEVEADDGGDDQGGIPDAGPGPAGPGVTPQSPRGNPGRPGWTDPNKNAANDKNFYQNVTSNPATSPAKGTSYVQPTPIGGQRGQEDYSKTPGSSNVWPTPTQVRRGMG